MKFIKYPPNHPPPSPATDAEIDACEKRHGINLPETLISLLKTQNGGDINTEELNEPLFENLLGVEIESDPSSPLWKQQIASLSDWLLYRGELQDANDSFPALESAAGDITKLIVIAGSGTYFYLLDYRSEENFGNLLYLDLVGGDGELRHVSDELDELKNNPRANP